MEMFIKQKERANNFFSHADPYSTFKAAPFYEEKEEELEEMRTNSTIKLKSERLSYEMSSNIMVLPNIFEETLEDHGANESESERMEEIEREMKQHGMGENSDKEEKEDEIFKRIKKLNKLRGPKEALVSHTNDLNIYNTEVPFEEKNRHVHFISMNQKKLGLIKEANEEAAIIAKENLEEAGGDFEQFSPNTYKKLARPPTIICTDNDDTQTIIKSKIQDQIETPKKKSIIQNEQRIKEVDLVEQHEEAFKKMDKKLETLLDEANDLDRPSYQDNDQSPKREIILKIKESQNGNQPKPNTMIVKEEPISENILNLKLDFDSDIEIECPKEFGRKKKEETKVKIEDQKQIPILIDDSEEIDPETIKIQDFPVSEMFAKGNCNIPSLLINKDDFLDIDPVSLQEELDKESESIDNEDYIEIEAESNQNSNLPANIDYNEVVQINSQNSKFKKSPTSSENLKLPFPLEIEIENEPTTSALNEDAMAMMQMEIDSRYTPQVSVNTRNYIVADVLHWTNTPFEWDSEVDNIRKDVFGLGQFRPNQKAMINAVLCKRDVFVVMPTGGGKSLIFQIPGILSKGVTFVVQPLISLIQDQICHLRLVGIRAVSLTSQIPMDKQKKILMELETSDDCPKLVYITPEKLSKSSLLRNVLRRLNANGKLERFVIDEVHCVSMWGRDFRPDYLELKSIKAEFPSIPVIGLTATATEKVRQDIVHQLSLRKCLYFQCSFNRKNLIYEVWEKPSKMDKSVEIIARFVKGKYDKKCGIVYCCSRKDCDDVAKLLSDVHGIKAEPYHSNLADQTRNRTQDRWMKDEVQIVVATIAFGMGIDKADVRFVIHYSMSKSIENYYQESGRAGRDYFPSHCIILYSFSDRVSLYTLLQKKVCPGKKQGEIDPITKPISTAHVVKMVRYCEEKRVCRRAIQLAYFGERFDPKDCHAMCDNCKSLVSIKTFDALKEAKWALEFLEKIYMSKLPITLHQLAECLRGRYTSKYKPNNVSFNNIRNFGCLKNWSKENIERLIKTMLCEELIVEKLKNNYAGHISAYIFPNERRAARLSVFPVPLRSTRTHKPESTTTVSNIPIPMFIAKTWNRDYGYCLPDQFERLLNQLKLTRLSIYNDEKEKGYVISSLDSFLPLNAIHCLCKWLPTGFDDSSSDKIVGLGQHFMRKFGEIFFDQISTFVADEGIVKEDIKGVPNGNEGENDEQVFDYKKVAMDVLSDVEDDDEDWIFNKLSAKKTKEKANANFTNSNNYNVWDGDKKRKYK